MTPAVWTVAFIAIWGLTILAVQTVRAMVRDGGPRAWLRLWWWSWRGGRP